MEYGDSNRVNLSHMLEDLGIFEWFLVNDRSQGTPVTRLFVYRAVLQWP